MNESIFEKYYQLGLPLLLLFLFGCATQSKDEIKAVPSVETAFSKDCVLLGMAVEQLTSEERHLTAPILSGCPGRYANRVRTVAEQRAFDMVLAENSAPRWLIELGVETERKYNRFVKKGVPPKLVITLLDHS